VKSDPKYAVYARETAMCVDLAYVAMEEDIQAELCHVYGQEREALVRLLTTLRERRAVLDVFARVMSPTA
jgi:hypothetical protein